MSLLQKKLCPALFFFKNAPCCHFFLTHTIIVQKNIPHRWAHLVTISNVDPLDCLTLSVPLRFLKCWCFTVTNYCELLNHANFIKLIGSIYQSKNTNSFSSPHHPNIFVWLGCSMCRGMQVRWSLQHNSLISEKGLNSRCNFCHGSCVDVHSSLGVRSLN